MAATATSAPPLAANEAAIRDYLDDLYGTADTGYLPIFRVPGERTDWIPIANCDAAAALIRQRSDAGLEVYHGMALHPSPLDAFHRGAAADVCALPGLYMDLDIAHAAAHTETALPGSVNDVLDLLDEFPLPATLLVHSGHGLYAHWLFREVLTIGSEQERSRVAAALRRLQGAIQRLGRERGWRFESTADLARVLRPPGVVNRKVEPIATCTLHAGGDRYILEEIEDILPDDGPADEPPRREAPSDNTPRAALALILRDCPFVAHCRDDAATLTEPEWHSMLTVVSLCEDGERHAHELSQAYPRYTHAETQNKYERARTADKPIRCQTVQLRHGDEWCARCTVRGTITSPIDLGHARIHRPGRNGASASGDTGAAMVDAPVFPLDVLPPTVRAYVHAAADSLSVATEMVALVLLALVGALIGNRLHLVLKASWREYATLYLAIIAPPGAAKSPALNLAKWPLDALQKDAHDRYTEQLAAYEADRARWKADGQKRGEPEPIKPRLRHYFSTDLTVEALAGMLAAAPGVAVVRDEISGWVAAMDQYKGGKGSDRQQYLSLWSAQTLKVDRKGGGSLYVPEPVACVVGGIQPDLAGTLHDAAQRRDGFVERILPVVPDVEPARWTDAAPSTEQYRDVLAVFQTLDNLSYPSAGNGSGLPCGYGVHLSREARALWVSWHDENAELIAAAEGLAAGFYSKLPAHVARLALILHALWHPGDPRVMVSAERVQDAIELGEFFRAHIGRFLALLKATAPAGSAGLHARILRILRNAHEHDASGWVSRSDIYRKLRNVTPAELTAALAALVDAGTIERDVDPGTTKPKEQYRIRISHYSQYPGGSGPETTPNGSDGGEHANNAKCETPRDDAWAGGEEGLL